ncbi:hypothetical protein BATDEDRAFT_91553 [Batrachochytrium dendrobatidis JAM81]|uniref:B30.2/SPRY domain-containing protein n=2 Tax=Batrachochytrium dendrobatidis TaxID=109871 RepID=F4PAI1_BATDJ|nr:uncharacterized protein BATDEDRAFT_91553 [Batrachochytrium dendrobatidis JAM81]EGF77544.1 hypothetical protein BATDEDRAFT_91553 [Batrachochytrium dendrobatidis JAM81]KAJ8323569.1 SPRY domain-containing protein 3 [Batrachochytrium dendrobatidis]KAK5666110.1 SPRY domain-containing protein 3 [Batrachochytrium dendrobatidis]OAJ43334.1 hypothetical protein BDEG_26701 [Batrachochytrium dendrobatidis JEL423]|eukprot:XP_006681753.1 hypothetical protein BATDEDRAFT_91553 [Batrachochytrium dendrobatidis JAM81]
MPTKICNGQHQAQSLLALPVELILDIADHLDAPALHTLAQVSSFLRSNLLRPSMLFSFAPRLPHHKQDITISHPFASDHPIITFTQSHSKSKLKCMVYDSFGESKESNGDQTDQTVRQVYHGLRKRGDRCCFSRMSLLMQRSLSSLLQPYSRVVSVPSSISTHAVSCSKFQAVYFEVTVIDLKWSSKNDMQDLPMRIGLVAAKDMIDHNHPPGSIHNSVAYRSNDGYVDLGQRHGELFQFAPAWGNGDTVGCGYARLASDRGTVFFTLNGRWVGDAPFQVVCEKIDYKQMWHAAVSSAGHATMAINYGQRPFKFQMGDGSEVLQLASRNRLYPDLSEKASLKKATMNEWVMEPNCFESCSNTTVYEPAVVSNHGCTIQFVECNNNFARSCLSALPFGYNHNLALKNANGKRLLYQYYEVTVTSAGLGYNSFMAVGLATKPYTPFHQIGWSPYSIGYHSDDARIFNNALQHGVVSGKPYSTNSTIGCGYCPEAGLVIFTQNGVKLAQEVRIEQHCYYAAVSAAHAWGVIVNFGQSPFVFANANQYNLT